jgi:hypothetical protein
LEAKREGDLLTVSCSKQKDAEEFAPIYLGRKLVDLGNLQTSLVLVPAEQGANPFSVTEQRILDLLIESFSDDGATDSQWKGVCEAAGVPLATTTARRRRYSNWAE